MNKWKTSQGTSIKQVLSGRSNAYLIETTEKLILVDTGKTSSYRTLLRNIRKVAGNRPIDYLLLTHTHYDHCQNAHMLQKEFGCQVVIHKAEAGYTNLGFTPVSKGINSFTRILSSIAKHLGGKRFSYEPFHATIEIEEPTAWLQEVPQIQLLHSPGHSAGSLSILVDGEMALVGDCAFGVFPTSCLPPFANDVPELLASWRKLLQTGASLFLPGHGSVIKRERIHLAYNRYS